MFRVIRKLIIKEININKDIVKMMKYKRILHENKKNYFLKKISSFLVDYYHNKIFAKYACDIIPEAQIGKVIFRHSLGIVIGGGAIIDDGVIIHQNVTFGALKFDPVERRGIMCKQHIKKNTIICTGAKILGNVTIGENCIVGANAIVTKDVPDGATVVGYNKIIFKNEKNNFEEKDDR